MGRPDAFLKMVRDIPSAFALRVIRLANSRSDTEIFSDIAVATSFADFVTNASMASSTDIVSPGFRYSLEGLLLAESDDIGICEFKVKFLLCNSSNTIYNVMIFANDAGYSCLSAFLAYKTRFDTSSITKDAYFVLACALDDPNILNVDNIPPESHKAIIKLIKSFFELGIIFCIILVKAPNNLFLMMPIIIILRLSYILLIDSAG